FTDGDLILAYLFGLAPNQLQPFVAANATRTVPQIIDYLNGPTHALLDVDGNGVVGAFTDGDLILAYLFGMGQNQLQPFVAANATRTLPQIMTYLQGLTTPQVLASALSAPALTPASALLVPSSASSKPLDGSPSASIDATVLASLTTTSSAISGS